MAAGLEPIRLKGEVEKIKEADAYIFSNICPYVKNLLDSGLRNRFESVDGIIFTNSCDGTRRLYDLWTHYINTPFTYLLEIPKNIDTSGITYFSAQLNDLKNRLETFFSVKISKDNLKGSISFMNDQRKTMTNLFEKQKQVPAPFKGSDLLSLCLEESFLPKAKSNKTIMEFSEQTESSENKSNAFPRILVIGNKIDRPDLFQMIENAQGSVVVFDTCNGLQHYSGQIEEHSDSIESLARRYLHKPTCARMPGFQKRIERLKQLINDYSIEGIIYNQIKFCDYDLFETPQIEALVKKMGLPFLSLENDYLWSDYERLKNRVEAFMEIVMDEFN